jgi:transposase-like protein
MMLEAFGFERAKEALYQRMVIGIPPSTHAKYDSLAFQEAPVGRVCVLAAAIGVVNQPSAWPELAQGYVQCRLDQTLMCDSGTSFLCLYASMQKEAKRRLTWIQLDEETHDVGLVCRRCGISSPTLRKWLRKWLRRYAEQGEAGLVSQSRRPKTSPQRKVHEQEAAGILELRRERNFGVRRIQQELRRQHQYHVGLEASHLVLKRHAVPPLRRPKRPQAPLRANAALPGERAQLDTMKLATGL